MNKRHYEHTLPNIRGSLSNTYKSRKGDCSHRIEFRHNFVLVRHGLYGTGKPEAATSYNPCLLYFQEVLYSLFSPSIYSLVFIYNSLRLSYLWKGPFPTGETTVSPKGNKNFP